MRENHLETPQREHSIMNRRSKSISDHSKKSHKINRKSLNAEFSIASGDVLAVESPPKQLIELSSISESSDGSLITDSTENFLVPLIPSVTPPSAGVSLADLSPSSSTTTSINSNETHTQNTHFGVGESTPVKISSLETDMMVKALRECIIQVLNSSDVNSRSKRLLDTLCNAMIEDLSGNLSDDQDWLDQLISKKVVVVLLSFLVWIILVSALLFSLSSDRQPSFSVRPT